MANTYTWSILKLECAVNEDGKENVVKSISWQLTATDGTNTTGLVNNSQIELNPDAPFISYEDLTEEVVLGWVQENLGEEKITGLHVILDAHLVTMQSPQVVVPALPWK